ncbi:hypothetical protein VNI00_009173 [Paramarasmius palmivorus]|uniref:Uncharacterized protein n=1 Tax=Paramarasmius palmivorus TaxID=297713 RepID=A0AAW0CR84_9AGAR
MVFLKASELISLAFSQVLEIMSVFAMDHRSTFEPGKGHGAKGGDCFGQKLAFFQSYGGGCMLAVRRRLGSWVLAASTNRKQVVSLHSHINICILFHEVERCCLQFRTAHVTLQSFIALPLLRTLALGHRKSQPFQTPDKPEVITLGTVIYVKWIVLIKLRSNLGRTLIALRMLIGYYAQ